MQQRAGLLNCGCVLLAAGEECSEIVAWHVHVAEVHLLLLLLR